MVNNKNGSPQDRLPHERLSYLLLALVGNKVIVTVKGGARHQGILAAATGDNELNVVLRQVQLLDAPNSQPKATLVIQARELLELQALDVSLDAARAASSERDKDAFKTDTDITGLALDGKRAKELQAWGGGAGAYLGRSDSDAISGGLEEGGNRPWDQFAVNEKLYGTRTDYNEEFYTTKLDRSTPDYRAREQRAAQIEREILKGSPLSNNAHMAEERGATVDDSNMDEEDRYSGVIRGPDAYIPPGARKGHQARFATNGSASPAPSPTPPPIVNLPRIQEPPSALARTTSGSPAPFPVATSPSPSAPSQSTAVPPISKTNSATSNSESSDTPSTALSSQIRYFVSQEKERLTQKRQAVVKAAERKDQDSRLASLLEFSQNFKLKAPMPADLATILGRDPNAKKESASTAASPVQSPMRPARTLTPAAPGQKQIASTSSSTSTPSKPTATTKGPLIPEIPPFNPNRRKIATGSDKVEPAPTPTPAKPTTEAKAPAQVSLAASTSKINANAAPFVFKPNPNASAFTPSFGASTPSPLRKAAELPINPFFGTKQIKKGSSSMHVKEDFTPFKNGVVQDASTIAHTWSFTGKSYHSMFPPTAPPPQIRPEEDQNIPPPAHHLPPAGGPPLPPQGYPMYQFQPQPQFGRFQPPPPPMHMPGGLQYPPFQGMPFAQPGYQPSPQLQPQMHANQQQGFIRYFAGGNPAS